MKKIILFLSLVLCLQAQDLKQVEQKVSSSITLEKDKVQTVIKDIEADEKARDLVINLVASFRAKLFDANLYTIKADGIKLDKVDKKADKVNYTINYEVNFDYPKYQALVSEFEAKLSAHKFASFNLKDSEAYMSALKLNYEFNPNFSYIFITTYNKPAFSLDVYEIPFKIEFSEDLDINTQAYQVLVKVSDNGSEITTLRDDISPLYSLFNIANANSEVFKGIVKEEKSDSFFSVDKYLGQKGNSIIIFPYFFDTKEQNIVGLTGSIQGELKKFSQIKSDPNFELSIVKAETLGEKAKSFFRF